MHDWKSELDALVAETMAFANSLKVEIERPRPQPKVVDEQVGLSVPTSDAIDTARSACRHSCGRAELPTAGAKLEIFAACSENRLCARQWFLKRSRGTAP